MAETRHQVKAIEQFCIRRGRPGYTRRAYKNSSDEEQ